MRWLTVLFALTIAFLTLGWTAGDPIPQRSGLQQTTTEATPTVAEAIPVVAETFDSVMLTEFAVSAGWYVAGADGDGFHMLHTDGARATIVQTEGDGSYEVAWHIIYTEQNMQCVSAGARRVDGAAPQPGEVGVTVNTQPDGRQDVESFVAPWPQNVGQTLVGQLNPATRQGICTR
jgi:hypothetical protein